MTTILISRSQDDAQHLAMALGAEFPDISVVIAPVFEVERVECDLAGEFVDAVVLTSRNAVFAAAIFFPGALAICVGSATADAATRAGLKALSAEGTSSDAVALARSLGLKRVAYLHGEHTVGDVTSKLVSAGIETVSKVVYRQRPLEFSDKTSKILSAAQTLIVPVFSPRSSSRVSAQLGGCDAKITLVAISEQAAQAWKGPAPTCVAIAEAPNATSMYAAIASQVGRSA